MTEDLEFVCDLCGKRYDRHNSVEIHLREAHNALEKFINREGGQS